MKLLRTIAVLFMTSLISSAGLADEGRAIVFIHGINSDASVWEPMVELFVENGLVAADRCLAVDYSGKTSLIGNGGTSGKILEAIHSWGVPLIGFNAPLDDIAKEKHEEIEKFRGQIGCRKLCFVVHSMGGLVLRNMVKLGYLH